MSLAVAIPFGVASATVYGTSIVVQHRKAAEHAGDSAKASSAGLIRLIRDPIFVLALGGDFIGFLLQLVALSTGPVVVIQPLVVLMLPVSLGVSYLMGGPRPQFGDYLGVLGIVGGLGLFLGLIGHPGGGHVPAPRVLGLTILLVLAITSLLAISATGRNPTIRGAMYGATAGANFGTLAVMVDAASDRLENGGIHGLLETPRGLVPIAGMIILGVAGIILTQMSFQVGALGATLPANLALDPFTGVLLGAILLREHVPTSPVHLVLYAVCIGAVLTGAIRLADRNSPGPAPVED